VQLLDAVQPIWTGCIASRNCTAFLSYLGVFELFAVQSCADVHFFVVIRMGVRLLGLARLFFAHRLTDYNRITRICSQIVSTDSEARR
jgi:hypothetical protein